MYGHEFGGGLMWILWVIVIAVIVWAVIKVATPNGRDTGGREKSAFDILKDRYANGEIDESEFDQKWKKLEQTRWPK